jgi:hypothetical protein
MAANKVCQPELYNKLKKKTTQAHQGDLDYAGAPTRNTFSQRGRRGANRAAARVQEDATEVWR